MAWIVRSHPLASPPDVLAYNIEEVKEDILHFFVEADQTMLNVRLDTLTA